MTDRALQKARRRELITFLAVAIPVSWIVLSLISLPLLADDLQDPRLLLPGWRIFAAFTIGPWVAAKRALAASILTLGFGLIGGLLFIAWLALGVVTLVFALPSIFGYLPLLSVDIR